MHFSAGQHGGDLNTDTNAIIGATLDLQEKVVRQASAPLVNCPSIFRPLTSARAGHDADQKRIYALD
jgi:hypothetical protein